MYVDSVKLIYANTAFVVTSLQSEVSICIYVYQFILNSKSTSLQAHNCMYSLVMRQRLSLCFCKKLV